MILHLEPGSCISEIDNIDLNESAAQCDQWEAFLDEDYRDSLLDREDLEEVYEDVVYPFHCPKCHTTFRKLSGLFQHVGSNACKQRLRRGKIGKLVRWLKLRHDLTGSD